MTEFQADLYWRPLGPFITDRRDKQARAFYRHLWSDEGQIGSFVLDWILLDSYLQFNGFQARYAFGYHDVLELPSKSLFGLPELIKPNSIFGGFPVLSGFSFDGMSTGMPRGPRNHPLTEGHATFAEAIWGWLRTDRQLDSLLKP
jgi:hypothetical protein